MNRIRLLVRHGENTVGREYPATSEEADRRFAELSAQRVDGPGAVVMTVDNIVRRQCRIDRDWPDDMRIREY